MRKEIIKAVTPVVNMDFILVQELNLNISFSLLDFSVFSLAPTLIIISILSKKFKGKKHKKD
jgi:hypothetical protein